MKERRKTTGKKLGNKRNTSIALFGMCCCHLILNILLGYFVWKKTIFSPPLLSSLAAWPDCKRREAFTVLLMSLASQMLESCLNCSPIRVIPFLTSAVPPLSFVTFPPRYCETLHLLNFTLSNLQIIVTLAVYLYDLTFLRIQFEPSICWRSFRLVVWVWLSLHLCISQ